jgi:hypothetical protein
MMLSFFLLSLFILTLGGFGVLVSRRILGTQTMVLAVGVGSVFGEAMFIVLANTIAYIAPVTVAFGSAFLLLLLASIVLAYDSVPSWRTVEMCPRWAWWVLASVVIVAALTNARFPGSDPWLWTHYPLPATIIAGNFPVMMPMNPDFPAGYHYAPALFAAATSVLTGFSIAASYAIQPLFGVVGILCIVAGVVYEWTRSWRTAVLTGVLAYAGSGFVWLKVAWFVRDLFQHFVFGPPLDVPFRALAGIFASNIVGGPHLDFGHRTFTLGIPFLFLFLLCLWSAPHAKNMSKRWAWIVSGVLTGAALALSMEASFLLLFPACALYTLVLFWRKSDLPDANLWRTFALCAMSMLIPTLVIACVQGGVLSHLHTGVDVGSSAFRFWIDGRIPSLTRRVGLWEWEAIRDFGLPFLLLPFTAWFVWGFRRKDPFPLFLLILLLGHVGAPATVRFLPREDDMARLFYVAMSLANVLAGLFLAPVVFQNRRPLLRALGVLAVICLIAASMLYTIVRLILPTYRWESAPLVAGMFPATAAEEKMYAWVRENTTLADRFYTRTVFPPPDTPRMEVGDLLHQPERILFMAGTGRFNLGPLTWGTFSESQIAAYHAIEERCDGGAFMDLRIRYLIVETSERAKWFGAHCTSASWSIRYNDGNGTMIYEYTPRPTP